jgi:hypothetical protein
MRGYDDTCFVYIDEASYFGWFSQEQESRAAAEGYIEVPDIKVVMVYTPSYPNTMFEQVMDESETTYLYRRYLCDYCVGLGKIFTQSEIDAAMNSPNWGREYNLEFGIGLGNCFLETNIKKCTVDYAPPTAEELALTYC